MESKNNNKKIIKLLLFIVLILSLTNVVFANKIDDKNEMILEKILSLDNITVNDIQISNSNVFVSIEVTEAMDYDTELISYWGSIFGTSAMLKNNNKSYETVIIENLIDGEAYMYVSTNVVTIQDYQNDLLEDHEFWEESLVTSEMPTSNEVVNSANLPKEALNEKNNISLPSINFQIKLWWIIVIILLVLVIFIYKKPKKAGKIVSHAKNKTKHVHKQIKHTYNTKGKKIGNHVKKVYNTHGKKLATKTKNLAHKAKEKSTEVYHKTKNKAEEKIIEFKEASKDKKENKNKSNNKEA